MHIERYRNGRSFAVYDDEGVLICVTLYKKGAQEVVRRLQALAPDGTTVSGNNSQLPTTGTVTAATRRRWRRALAIAAMLFTEEGYHTASILALSDFVAQLPEETQP